MPVSDAAMCIDQSRPSGAYAAGLLRSLGVPVDGEGLVGDFSAADVAEDWAASGLMHLTGSADGPPLQGPGAIPSCARGALLALRRLSAVALPAALDGAQLLSERAALMGLRRGGRVSPNGSCHLLPTLDGWLALNLARDDDWSLLPAWLQCEAALRCWPDVADAVGGQRLSPLIERARLMGLPAAPTRASTEHSPWYRVHYSTGAPAVRRASGRPALVIDLSSLWAGPLCCHLLWQAGARVIKVESRHRLDGARAGCRDFYHLLNQGKASVVLDLHDERGRAQLRQLLARADIVVEGSRPRALRQMGIEAEALLRANPGLTWLGITGYGRSLPQADWVAFGDDAAVAAGVAAATADPPRFCGDALADPLTGIHAACAALAHWRGGGGVLLDLSLPG